MTNRKLLVPAGVLLLLLAATVLLSEDPRPSREPAPEDPLLRPSPAPVPPPEAVAVDPEELAAVLRAGEPAPGFEAARALVSAGEEAIPFVLALLRDPAAGPEFSRINPWLLDAKIAYVLEEIGEAAVPHLLEAVRRGENRPFALRVLGRIGRSCDAPIDPLIEFLASDDSELVIGALFALGGAGRRAAPALERVLEMTRGERYGWAACQVAGEIGAPAVDRIFEELRAGAGHRLAWGLADALRDLPDGGASRAAEVAELLFPGKTYQREALCWWLRRLGPAARDAAPVIARVFCEAEYGGRSAVAMAEALVAIDPETALAVLTPLLDRKKVAIRFAAAGALAKLGPRGAAAAPVLMEMHGADYKRMPTQHVSIMVSLGAPMVPEIVKGLEHEEARFRWPLLRVLASLGPDAMPAMGAVVGQLQDEDPLVRRSAVQALGAMESRDAPELSVLVEKKDVHALLKVGKGDHDIREMLASKLGDKAVSDRVDALEGLLRWYPDDPRILAALIRTIPPQRLGDRYGWGDARARAIDLLASMGEAARPAIPAIRGALRDRYECVEDAAKRALAAIDR